MKFEYEFTKKEEAALKEFKKKYTTGPYSLAFINTGIGTVVTVKDEETGKSRNITDYGCW